MSLAETTSTKVTAVVVLLLVPIQMSVLNDCSPIDGMDTYLVGTSVNSLSDVHISRLVHLIFRGCTSYNNPQRGIVSEVSFRPSQKRLITQFVWFQVSFALGGQVGLMVGGPHGQGTYSWVSKLDAFFNIYRRAENE